MPMTHTDFSEKVINHYAETGNLLGDVYLLEASGLRELIDAVPDTHTDLIILLRQVYAATGAK